LIYERKKAFIYLTKKIKIPKKDRFLIGKNKIFIILESELSKIPEIVDP